MDKYLKEAIRIGDQLLSEAEKESNGISWKTTNLTTDLKIAWDKSEGMYSGSAGIIIFLTELYRQTKEKRYLEAAEQGMEWTLWFCKQNKTKYYALFTGRLGVSFALLKLYEVTKKERYRKDALQIAKQSLSFLEMRNLVYDLINGISGTLLGLMHLHAATQEPWLLEHIEAYTQKLLDGARFSKYGLYWDVGHSQIRPLCGFSHGSSGIGFVFLEMAHYFKNPAFQYVAEQAFAYENAHYDTKMHNWPDFRLNMYGEEDTKEYEDKYLHNDFSIFTTAGDANQWCHGAAGIGLARARWYELTKNKTAREDMQKALEKTKHIEHGAFTYCHGAGGNADLFFEMNRVQPDPAVLEHAYHFADAGLVQKQKYHKYYSGMKYDREKEPEDRSLFNGIAGIGYFFLRVHNPQVPSILAPILNSTSTVKSLPKMLAIDTPHIKRYILANAFPRTIEQAELLAQGKVEAYFQKKAFDHFELESFISFITKLQETLPTDKQQSFAEDFYLEYKKVALYESNESIGLVYMQDRINLKRADTLMKLTATKLQQIQLILSSTNTLATLSESQQSYLLRLTPYGTEALAISNFCELVLKQFENAQTVEQVVASIMALYDAQTKADKELVKEKVIAQIQEAIQYGILIQA